ncbi:MAG: DUF2939 domain-containing protein [Pseudomonadota bacterium]
MKKFLLLAVLLVAAYAVASPFLTMAGIHSAVETNDQDKLQHHIDFEAVRVNMKRQISEKMGVGSNKKNDNPFAALASGMAATVVGGLLETTVTPSTIMDVFGSESSNHRGESHRKSSGDEISDQETNVTRPKR